MFKSFVLIKHLEFHGGADELRVDRQVQLVFPDFTITKVRHWEVPEIRRIFPQACRDDLVLEKTYNVGTFQEAQAIVPFEMQDTLLLLRLFRPGDIAFVELKLQEPDGNLLSQPRYWATGDCATTRPLEFSQNDVTEWVEFGAGIVSSISWHSSWFRTASRYFLIGGAKEFNTWVEPKEVERVLDYLIAVEAMLTIENDFVGRRIKNRAVSLLGLDGDEAVATKRLITQLYTVRSTIAHGDSISDGQALYLRTNRNSMEQLVRKLLVAGLRTIPRDAAERSAVLKRLYDVSDSERAETLRLDFRKLSADERRALIDRLRTELN